MAASIPTLCPARRASRARRVGGLTFQLAADIVEPAIASTWDDIGRVGAVAVFRTFLNYFLVRDLAEAEKREAEA